MTLRLSHSQMGLRTKFVLVISLLIVITSTLLSWYLIRRQSILIERELGKRAESLVRNLAFNSEYGVLVENQALLLNLMKGLSQEEDVRYITIQDRSGKILADWHRTEKDEGFDSEKLRIIQQIFNGEKPQENHFTLGGEEFSNFSYPIKTQRIERSKEELGLSLGLKKNPTYREEIIGMAHIGMSLQHMRREIADMRTVVILLTLVVVLAGISLTVLLVNVFLKPVKKLVQATKRIANGDLTYKVEVAAKDEIGMLASSFNQMTGSLKESREKIEEYNRNLEYMVKERTAELEKTTRLLQTEYNRLEAIINSPNLGVLIEDKDCNIRFMNKTLIETFGQQVGQKCYEKLKGQTRMCSFCPIEEILVKGKNSLTYLDQDNLGHFYELSASLFQDEKGEKFVLETLRDITERKKLETQVEEYTHNLEKTNDELAHALQSLKETQSQLIQVEKMAAVGQLAAGVAHELNNPLGGILGYSQFALEKIDQKSLASFDAEDTRNLHQYLKDIEEQTKKCRAIIQSLLKFSRASKHEDHQPTDIAQVLKETLVFTQHQIVKHKVKLLQELEEPLPLIQGHPSQLQQVFTNLILNAVQAMPQGGTLTVQSRKGEGSKTVEVSFIDTGTGIAAENLDKVFEPFFTTKKVGEGTGLGLSVSYGLIKEHGGEIKVKSQKNQGASFTVILPVSETESLSGADKEGELVAGKT
jgi:signal transduction histidine kinase/HAMP domain-containing protein